MERSLETHYIRVIRTLHKPWLIIQDHSIAYQNSGSLIVALSDYYKRLASTKKYDHPVPLIAIVADIAFHNPRTYPIAAAILSKLVSLLGPEVDKSAIVTKIRRKFAQIPNTGHMDIWLQRIVFPFDASMSFDEPLCRLVSAETKQIWDNSWINYGALQNALDSESMIDRDALANIEPVVPFEEIELFKSGY